jgi:hypothetical protein
MRIFRVNQSVVFRLQIIYTESRPAARAVILSPSGMPLRVNSAKDLALPALRRCKFPIYDFRFAISELTNLIHPSTRNRRYYRWGSVRVLEVLR